MAEQTEACYIEPDTVAEAGRTPVAVADSEPRVEPSTDTGYNCTFSGCYRQTVADADRRHPLVADRTPAAAETADWDSTVALALECMNMAVVVRSRGAVGRQVEAVALAVFGSHTVMANGQN